MARKTSGGLSKLLNFIGLVDDEDTRDTYGEEYSGNNYGRQAAYTPARQQRPGQSGRGPSRSADSRRQPAGQGSARGARYDADSRYDSGRGYEGRAPRIAASRDYDDYNSTARRNGSRFDDSGYGEGRSARSSSRYSSQPDARYSGNLPARAPQMRTSRPGARSRTVMYSLHSLEDCCEVIDQLIANNTVVLTMDELDGHLLQRAVDTLSGAVFALHANIRKASDRTYLIAPMSVEVNEAYDMGRRF